MVNLTEVIIGGVCLSILTSAITKFFVGRNVVTKDDCAKNQGSCIKVVAVELGYIKDGMKDLKEGQKEVIELINTKLIYIKNPG
jgi:hypothetical protein